MSIPPSRPSPISLNLIGWGIGMLTAFIVIYYAIPKNSRHSDDPLPAPTIPTGSVAGSLCEKKLIKWIQSVNPQRLQFDTDIESRVQELNRYWASCGPQGGEKIVTDVTSIEASLNGAYRDQVMSPRFDRRDIEHIRQSLLFSRMAVRVAETQLLDQERAVSAAVEIAHQLVPRATDLEVDNPLTPFECLLLGTATPREAAWILAEQFRQLHLDAAVLTVEETTISPLVAVIVDKEVLLFDPLTGLPIPKPAEQTRRSVFRTPATLSEALADDVVFRQLDLEQMPFAWTSERLRGANVELVGSSSTWAPRSAELQFQWPSTESCVIYDGLGASQNTQRGLIERVQALMNPLGYASEKIRVWQFPERQCQRYDTLGAEGAEHMKPMIALMGGPKTFQEIEDQQTGQWTIVPQRLKRTLQQARVLQLLGDTTEAIGSYLPMLRSHRIVPKNPSLVDARIRDLMDQNRLVADRAIYWMAATQFENDDFSACNGTLRMYNREFPLGQMREVATLRMAACLAHEQKWAEAAQLLDDFGSGPQLQRRRLLARRYREVAALGELSDNGKSPPSAQETTPAASPDKVPESPDNN